MDNEQGVEIQMQSSNRLDKMADWLDEVSEKKLDITQQQARLLTAGAVALTIFTAALASREGGTPIPVVDGGDVWGTLSRNADSIINFIKTPAGQHFVQGINNAGGANAFQANLADLQTLEAGRDATLMTAALIPGMMALSSELETKKDKLHVSTTVLPAIANVLRAASGKQG